MLGETARYELTPLNLYCLQKTLTIAIPGEGVYRHQINMLIHMYISELQLKQINVAPTFYIYIIINGHVHYIL